MPQLPQIKRGPGTGSHYLPVTRTTSPVDADIVQDIYQQPIAQRFSLILNELGTGLAARGSDLNAVIHRANPALGYTDQVLKILARQNRQLAQLATDSDKVLAPLAKVKSQIAGFVTHANTTSVASAARARDISRSFQLFPQFLRQLRPLMVSLGNLADQGTPLMASLGQSAVGARAPVPEPGAVRQAGDAGADRARQLLPAIPAGAGRDRAARPAAQEPRHAGGAVVGVAGQAHRQPRQHGRDRAADVVAVRRNLGRQRL